MGPGHPARSPSPKKNFSTALTARLAAGWLGVKPVAAFAMISFNSHAPQAHLSAWG